jgi:acetate---CoA ligase (ADP-forming)
MSFESFLRPKSVAVVGASSDRGKVGNNVLDNILSGGFEGEVYPINPKADEILGKKCYPSLNDVPGPIDLAVIVIKRDLVIPVLKDCVAKSIKAVVVITAGFAETGEEGKKLQKEITEIAKENGITLMGPNCLGLINPWHKLNASFGQGIGAPGSIGLISQSGALITAIQDMAANDRIGFSVLASLGNKATLDEVEFLKNLKSDENTKVIGAYLEDISRGQDFVAIAEEVGKEKPIIILKAGRTAAGAKAASSHTGSLAGADSAYNSAFERTGVVRADSIEHLFDVATAFAYQPLPKGGNVAVVTNAGGPGIMMSDALEMAGVSMAKLDGLTKDRLRKILPAAASVHNPVDVLGDASGDLYGAAMDILLSSDDVDSCIVILTPQKMTDDVDTAQAVVDASKKYSKPVLACFMGAKIIEKGVALLQNNDIPQYEIPERAARAMREMVAYSEYKQKPPRKVEQFDVDREKVAAIIQKNKDNDQYEIGEIDAKEIMRAYQFNVPPGGVLAPAVEDAVQKADAMGYPVVIKISSPDILHKSDVGGVKVGLADATAVKNAFESMMTQIKEKKPNAKIDGVLIEKMIMGGKEVILGLNKDPQFGPVIMYGLGGIFVEVLKDVAFGLAPLTAEEAHNMMKKTKSYRLLTGARGEKPVDIDAIVENLQRLSQLVVDFPEISEIDINPLKVAEKGAIVVDARIIIAKNT